MFKKILRKMFPSGQPYGFLRSKYKDFLVMALAVGIGIYLRWNIVEIAIFMIFVFTIINPLPSRYVAIMAILFLIFTPFLLIYKKEALAETFSIYAYYFLIITVIMAFYELKKEEKTK